ncbi:hypothetical protein KOW79_019515 [Hemibagrus wyckioides]|uniref:Epiplakin n=1 Tax=Hemibagrus wyckioides TaxID=337641 RepID=A0A9D3N7S9_9TELE|nr:hypothetical protein KOW79_019515 [Hemibagrus wyckioides]
MDSVRKYLQGTDCIAGVFVQSTKQTMSIYEAKSKGLLTPGTALVLLEAQAATGFMIDPVNNKKLSVEEAVAEGVVGTECKNKLISAERAVTGYTDPHTGNTISLFQALKKDLIVKDHGIRLLEAQIATGGIIDPVYSHRVPVEVAYQRGYFDEEMNQILLDPSDDTKGLFDPNTKENLTYLQLLDRCIKDPHTGLRLLVVVKRGEFYFYIDEHTKTILQSTTTNKAGGKFQGKEVSLWDLLHSEYIEEEKKRDLVQQFKSGTITSEYFLKQVLTIIRQKTSSVSVTTTTTTTTTDRPTFRGIKKQVTALNLLESKIIDQKIFEDLSVGKVTVDQVSNMDSVRKYLQGTDCIAGVFVQSTKQTMSISEAKSKGLLTPGTSLVLLEAQAATGFMVDPLNNKKLSVEEAVAEGVVGTEWKNKLLSAEKAVTGYTDPHTGNTISLFQALKKDLIVKDHGIRLLEAQIATGGIIDPVYSHRVPVEVAYQRGYFDEEMNQILLDPGDDTKGFFDPNTQENLTYLQLLDRCIKDPYTGLRLLVVVKKGEFYFYIDERTKTILQSTTTNKAGGKFQGKEVSLWDLIHSEYIEEEKKRDLVQQFKSGTITSEYFLEHVLTIIRQKTSSVTVTTTTTTTTTDRPTFRGIKKQVTALNLLESKIIDQKIFEDLSVGKVTVDQVSNMDSVRKYLQGTDCIAGVFVQSTKQTMSISEAKSKGLLTPGTSLVLLEAQAATGFMVDPLNNKKLSVEEAVAEGVVGTEWKIKLLSAERAVTGYTDPHTGNTISLLQALKKDLIVKDHGIRLLEAQIATGGIIDPVYSHRVPVEVAYQRGYFDEEMNQILSDPGDDTKGFFDPNTQENLTYLQLLDRCIKDPHTGLRLLVVVKKGEFYFYIDERTKTILQSTTTNKAGGKFQGKEVSLWDLIHSEYIEEEKKRDLVQQFKSGTITSEYFLEQVLTIILQKTSSVTVTTTTTTTTTDRPTFRGIKKQVTALNLLESKIIDQKIFEDLSVGKVTVDQVSNMDSVRKYLQGTDCIAGVFVQSTKQTMSISEAKSKGLLTPGTSLVLLEAQAATGFMVDPLNNKKLSVEEAVAEGVVGTEWKNKLLSAEKAVTGYTDPHTGNTISLFQALKKDLIVKDHGIRLLEAQIATGGIIDPVYSHRVPVEVAYQRGYFDEEMNQILLDPGDDTKGFFDPNTQENLTYLQLLDRCIKDPYTGLRLLVVVKKGEFYFYIDERTKTILQSTTTNKAGGKFQGKEVSLWDLIHSEYIEEEKKRDLVQQFKSGTITSEYFLEHVLTIIRQKTSSVSVTTTTTTTTTTDRPTFRGIKKQVTALNLLESKIIDQKIFEDLSVGKVTVDQVSNMDSVRKYLQGTDCIAGVFVQSTKQTMSISEAKSKGLLTPGTSLVLLEAQAATGFMVDPLNNKKLSVEEAVAEGVVGTEWKNKLLSAERAVTGYTDPHTGNTISLFQALKKDLIVKDHGIRLLEAQIATGGIIDPVYSHRVPVEVAYQRGYFDEEMNQILSDPGDDTKGFFDPNTQENLTYLQLLDRCIKDPHTGLRLLVVVKKGEFYFYIDERTKTILQSTTTNKAGGKFQGKEVSLWDLIHSEYIEEEKKRNLVQQFKSGTITSEYFLEQVLTIILQKTSSVTVTTTTTTTTTDRPTFRGIKKQVTALNLLESKIIDQKIFEDLSVGKVTVDQVSNMDSVRKYLQGTDCIAGVFVQSTKQTMSISEAKSKGLLTPGTSLVLLEAQAATGFMVDPLNNKKLSVEEAVAEGVVGTEWKNKLLSAEKAVTGYTDPHTGNTISLFQALKKDLIVKDHGIRLLEAQIATGGIIDPVYSHRVPVEVAYQRGYFDEEMNQILLDPGDDTKGFFDPNTQENLTYLQLLDRCIKDPYTGLRLLVVVKKGEFYFYIDERTKTILQSTTTNKAGGKFQGKEVSLWDLIHSEYIEEEKKRDLVQQFKSGTITSEYFLEHVLTIIRQKTSSVTVTTTTTTTTTDRPTFRGIKKQVTALNLLESKIIDQKIFEDLSVGKVTVDQVSNMDSVRKYLQGTDCIAGVFVQSTKQTMSISEAKSKGLLTPGTSLVLLEAQAATGFMVDPLNNKKLSVEEAVAEGVVGTEWKNKLLSAERAVTGYTDPHTGNTISLFQALKKDLIVKDHGIRLLEAQIATGGIIDPVYSHRVPVEVAYQRGYFDEEMNQILSDPGDDTKGFFDPNTQENLTYLQLLDRCIKDPHTGLRLLVVVKKGEFYFYIDERTKTILQTTTTNKAGGKFQGKEVSLWDLIHSEYIEEEKKRDLVQQFKSGTITSEYFLEQVLTIILQKTSSVTVTTTTTTTTTDRPTFRGIKKQVTALNLLESKIIDQKIFEDLSVGKVTVDQVSNMDSVRKYLQGTDCIAGVFVQSTKQTMSISEAKSKGLLTPGTSLVLLEAQAATGFMVDPLNNKKLSVEEAVAEGVVGTEWKNKLLSAERAVTGYTDPHTGNTISLFQALKKDLIVKDHGIRLLEAQIATGGIIDPVYSHRVPVEVAYQRGYFDEEMNQILSDPGDDTKGFFDPNTQENLTYLQLLDRCIKDPHTGLRLLVVVKKGEFYFYIDERTKTILQSTTTNKAGGKFQGKEVSLWDLIHSEYIEEEKKRDLVQQFKSGTITSEYFLEQVLTIILQKTSSVTVTTTTTTTTTTTDRPTFRGIKKQVTALNLLESKIIDQKIFEDLSVGKVTVDQVSNMDSVRKYLQGTDCIAGVFVQSTKQTMSISEAKSKGLLTPGTSLVLLEAQAATGFMVDPLNNKKLSVEEAVAEGVVGTEWKNKLLSAERAVTGYTDPHTGNTISLFQALKKDLIVKDHGIRLLEAQIATGGIIDPVYSHRVPVEVAYQRGYFDEEMNQILSDPGDDTKGFFDPNTQENLTYLQLLDRCIKDPHTGLRLLVVVKKGEFYFYIDERTKTILQSTTTNEAGGKFQGKEVSLWDLIHSEYIEEKKKRDLVQQFKSGTITSEYFLEQVLTIIRQKTSSVTVTTTTTTTTTDRPTFWGIKKQVTALNLLESKIIDQKIFEDLSVGNVTVDQSTKQTMSIYEAKSKGLLTPGTSLVLLEAQAATGFMVDPLNNKKLSVEEAVAEGVVGNEWKNKLLSAEKAVTGYTDPHTGNTISLFQALKKDLIVKDHGIRLLEAQIATGGIIDPVYSHRVPVEVAYQRGYFDEEMNQILLDPGDDTKGFFDPNTQENLTYLQLLDRCIKDPHTGLRLLVVVKKGEFYFYIDERTKTILQSTTTNKAGGKFQGKEVSLWDLIHSEYIEEEKKRDLVQQFKSGTITSEYFLEQVLTIIRQKTSSVTVTTTITTTTTKSPTFCGIKKQVTALNLLESKIIDKKIFDDLSTGKVTVDQVSNMESVRKYLQGTDCIAGVFVQSTKQTMSIYEAKSKGLLTPGTSLVLLEAQAATGFMVDPLNNKKLSVEEAVAEGVVGNEWKNKLLSAEKAVTGYTDPHTGNTISLFQALKKDLIVKDHGIRLLEAQIATGGIIDPVYSHRVPVEVAYQRGYFDEEMNQILSDPGDDTKGFFDPNTQENLTYLQLLNRCVKDPHNGLTLLILRK